MEPRDPEDVSRETPDPVDEAIAAVEAQEQPEVDHMVGDFTFVTGHTMKLIVPIEFDADEFETAVGVLMQMRVAAEARKTAKSPIVVPPPRPTLVAPDGRPLS